MEDRVVVFCDICSELSIGHRFFCFSASLLKIELSFCLLCPLVMAYFLCCIVFHLYLCTLLCANMSAALFQRQWKLFNLFIHHINHIRSIIGWLVASPTARTCIIIRVQLSNKKHHVLLNFQYKVIDCYSMITNY